MNHTGLFMGSPAGSTDCKAASSSTTLHSVLLSGFFALCSLALWIVWMLGKICGGVVNCMGSWYIVCMIGRLCGWFGL